MKNGLLAVICGVVALVCAAQPAEKAVTENYDWYDGAAVALEGQGFPKTAAPFTRLPEVWKDRVTPKVWGLSQTAIDFNTRFITDSNEIVVRWSVTPKLVPMYMMPLQGFAGVDIYARTENGWEHIKAAVPNLATGEGEVRLPWRPGTECRVYLPIRARPHSFSIGVKKGKTFLPGRPHAVAKPVVHYGTSIVNGGSASRSGLIFTAIYGRLADVEVVNLGFSGAGKMELPMAELLAEIDASLYIVDCDWNMFVKLQKERYEPFVRKLKALRPNTPILLCGGCTEKALPRDTEVYARSVYDKLKAEDQTLWSNLHFLSGVDMLPKTSECTHDHCHPNDFGYMHMGPVYAQTIQKILNLR